MTAPAWLADADDDYADDLAALGLSSLTADAPLGQAQLEALASDAMGRLAEYQQRLDVAIDAEAAEHNRITARYEQRNAPLLARIHDLAALVTQLAERCQFSGKAKSVAVGNGTIGRRKKPESIKVADSEKALEAARRVFPNAVVKEVVYTLPHKVVAPLVLAHLKATGELLDGFEHTAEAEVPYFKVAL